MKRAAWITIFVLLISSIYLSPYLNAADTPSFSLSITTTDNVIAVGETTTMQITLKNETDSTTGNVKVYIVTDTTALEVVKTDSTWGAFDINSYIWYIGNLDKGQSAMLTLIIKGKKIGAHGITIKVYENDSYVMEKNIYIGVEEEPDIDVTVIPKKSINFALGETPYVELAVLNRGGQASGVKVSFQTDSMIRQTGKAMCSQGTMAGNSWNIGTMIKGQTVKCLIQITALAEGKYNGILKVESPLSDSNDNNDETMITFNVIRRPNTEFQMYTINPFFLPGDNIYIAAVVTIKGPSPEKDLNVILKPTGGSVAKVLLSKGTFKDDTWTLGDIVPGIYFAVFRAKPDNDSKPILIEANLKSPVSNIKRVVSMSPQNISDIALILPDDKDGLDTAKSYPLPIVVLNKGTTPAENIVVTFSINGGSYQVIDVTDGEVIGNTWNIKKLYPGSSASLYIDLINTKEGPVSVETRVKARTKTKDINPDNNSATWTGYFEDKGAPASPIVEKIGVEGRRVKVLIVSPADKDVNTIWTEIDGREIFRFKADPGTSYLKDITLPSDGNFVMKFYAEDTFGNNSKPAEIPVSIDTTPPFTIWNIPQKGVFSKNPVNVTGMTEPGASLIIRVKAGNLREAYYQPDIDKEGKFHFNMFLFKGVNEVCLSAQDLAGNTYKKCSVVSYPSSTVISFRVGKKEGYVNGKKYLLEVPATIVGNTTYIPVRFLAEAMGMELGWYGMERKIVLSLGETTLTLYLDKPYAIINGKGVNLGRKLPVIQGRSLVPARFIAETFGARVQWIPETKMVKIIYP